MNDDVRRFVSDAGSFAPLKIEELETAAKRHLKVTRASASYLLAMKCLSCRPPLPGHKGDINDIEFLIRKMNIRTIKEVEENIDRFYRYDGLSSFAKKAIKDLILKEGSASK